VPLALPTTRALVTLLVAPVQPCVLVVPAPLLSILLLSLASCWHR